MAEYLEREKVFFALEEFRMMETMSKHATYKSCAIARDAMEKMQIVVAGLPIADVAPVVHGQWIADGDGYHWTYNCSICAWKDGYPFNERHNFCPNCGAKMDGGING